jgi:hypothetical protein
MSTLLNAGGRKMKRFQFCISVFGLLVLLFGAVRLDAGYAGAMDLVSMLVDNLGITKQQAKGGAGALFQNAKNNLSGDDFQKVADAVPGMDNYLASAPSGSKPGGVLGTLSSLGGSAAKVGSLASLTDSFSKLGMDSSMLSKFIPVVLQFVQSKGGDAVIGLLKGLWR